MQGLSFKGIRGGNSFWTIQIYDAEVEGNVMMEVELQFTFTLDLLGSLNNLRSLSFHRFEDDV